MQFLFNFIMFILLLMVIVVVHEFGHLITAKHFNVYCSEFSIGMGPALYQNKNNETVFSIRALPLGGYVQMAGEEGTDTTGIPYERTIKGIKTWQQVVVMAAGAFMNVVLAWVIFVGIVMARGSVAGPALPVLSGIIENSPAEKVGLQPGDEIVKVTLNDGTSFIPETFDDIIARTQQNPQDRIILTVSRAGQIKDYMITPELQRDGTTYLIGIQASSSVIEIQWYEAFKYGTMAMGSSMMQIISALGNLVEAWALRICQDRLVFSKQRVRSHNQAPQPL